jgi:hypothetical protein
VPPGPELVIAEARAHAEPEPPRVTAVPAPRRQPRAQLVVVGQHGPVPQPLGDLAGRVHDERLRSAARHCVHPPLAGVAVPDADRAEPRAHGQRRDGMPGFVPGRPHGRKPGRPVGGRIAAFVALPDPHLVHDGLVVVADEPVKFGLYRGQGRGLHRGDKTQNSLPSGSASTAQLTSRWPTSTGTAPRPSSRSTSAA